MDMPELYRSLLVHEGDMTSRLEAHHERSIKVSRLRSSNNGKLYFREVMLQTEPDDKPTEYGAIEVNLSALPEEARALVLQAKQPLGGFSTITGYPIRVLPGFSQSSSGWSDHRGIRNGGSGLPFRKK